MNTRHGWSVKSQVKTAKSRIKTKWDEHLKFAEVVTLKKYEEISNDLRIWDITRLPTRLPIMYTAYIKLPDCGTCSVVWSENEDGWEHVSVSPKKKFNTPTWNDMCVLKEVFFRDDEEAYQIHPKKSEYVNIQDNCLHLWKPVGHEINEVLGKQAILASNMKQELLR